MDRPGNMIFYGMLIALLMQQAFDAKPWTVIVAAFAIGWYFNERERTKDA